VRRHAAAQGGALRQGRGKSITETTALTIREAYDFLHDLKLSPRQKEIAGRILRESGDRLGS
jgi:excinuclease UvrABC ATPase subunit